MALGLPASPDAEPNEDEPTAAIDTDSPGLSGSPRKLSTPINIQQLMFSLIQIFYINEEIKQIRELGFTTPDRPKNRDSNPTTAKEEAEQRGANDDVD